MIQERALQPVCMERIGNTRRKFRVKKDADIAFSLFRNRHPKINILYT